MFSNKIKYNSYKCGVIAIIMITGLFPAATLAAMDRASVSSLLAHKALYDIRLSSKKSSTNISNISGKMFYELQTSCDAWISTNRFDMTYEYLESPSVRITSEFSSYESFDGKEFNFTVNRKSGGMLLEEIRGRAKFSEDGNNEIIYSMPEGLIFDLPKGTLFPVAHTLAVINKIKDNQKFYNNILFDGSDDEGPVEVNSFFTGNVKYSAGDHGNNIDKRLLDSQAWGVRLAFFPLSSFEEISDYEMSVILHENGVISGINVDYNDFSVVQKLSAIEFLNDECETKNNINKIKSK